jgi:hypothetical protein
MKCFHLSRAASPILNMRLIQLLLFIPGLLLMVIAGTLAYLLGVYVSTPLIDDMREIVAIAVGTTLASALAIGFLKFVIRTSARNIFPLGYLLLTCFILGFFDERLSIPKGFELIAEFIMLIVVGMYVAKEIRRRTAQERDVTPSM